MFLSHLAVATASCVLAFRRKLAVMAVRVRVHHPAEFAGRMRVSRL